MNQIAETIRQQLGGAKFEVMTGANSFSAGSNWLQFKVPGVTKNRANHVRITLETADTYIVEFIRVWNFGLNHRRVSLHRGVQAAQLRELFTAETGLYTGL